jgi:hypothetical protein
MKNFLFKVRKIYDIIMYPGPEITWEDEVALYDWVKTLNERIDRVEDNQVFLRGQILDLDKKIQNRYNK